MNTSLYIIEYYEEQRKCVGNDIGAMVEDIQI